MFCKNILKQPIWANDLVYVTEKGQCKLLYYKNWIVAGITCVGNLRFVDGMIDENYIYNIVQNKVNIIVEVGKLKKALKPYRLYIGDHEPTQNIDLPYFIYNEKELFVFKSCRSKPFYKMLVNVKVETPAQEEYWKTVCNIEDTQFRHAYYNKVISIKDKKLAEFNFKIHHNILPCNNNPSEVEEIRLFTL